MKILLDESLPRRLKNDFVGHQVKTVTGAGWQGKKNGELLKLMEGKFDVFVTAYQNLSYQLNLHNTSIPIIIVKAETTRYESLKNLVPRILQVLKKKSLERIVRIHQK